MDYMVLRGAQKIGSSHFCSLEAHGEIANRFRFLIMKAIGLSLWQLRDRQPHNRFSLGTALKVAEQCLVAIEQLHQIGFLHRDVKPGNFAIGREETQENHIIFVIDFGLCRKYRLLTLTSIVISKACA
ncbi:hypothetical protein AB6A40_006491 [Gnathostoma spinigerum]|uniref:Protein kinase domain-containing protein n=1 Tax=Gnathostoma spinigerum TaxID=75299 RepID=A0ABD6EKQ9_9BILA